MAPGAPHQGPFRADTYASRSRTTPQLRAPPRHARPRATASLGGRCGSRPPTRRVPVAEPRPLRSTPSGGRAAPPLSSPFANPAAAQGAPTGSDAGRWSRPTPAVTRPDAVTLGGATVAAVALMSVDERVAPWGQSRTVQGARAPARHRGVPRPRRPRRARGGQRDLRDRARPPRPRRRRRRAARHRRDRRGGGRHGRDRGGRGACPPVRHGRLQRAQLRVRAWPAPRQRLPAFPSGHATAAFAFAAALSGEGRRRWARANRVTELLAYTAASLVALSRVYHDRHWASDAVMGSAIGLVTGRALVRYQHECPADAPDGRLPPGRAVRAAVIPAAVSWSIRF